MSNQSIQVANIITYLESIPAITWVVWTRIYFWAPIQEPIWTFLVINIISQVPDLTNKIARLEFRFIWATSNATKKSLIDLQDALVQELVWSIDWWVKTFWTFKVYLVEEWPSFQLFEDDKNRPLLIKDILFHFSQT